MSTRRFFAKQHRSTSPPGLLTPFALGFPECIPFHEETSATDLVIVLFTDARNRLFVFPILNRLVREQHHTARIQRRGWSQTVQMPFTFKRRLRRRCEPSKQYDTQFFAHVNHLAHESILTTSARCSWTRSPQQSAPGSTPQHKRSPCAARAHRRSPLEFGRRARPRSIVRYFTRS